MSAIPALPDGYWAKHQTIVITWPGDMPGVFASARWQRNEDGSLSVEYTREELELAVGGAAVSSRLRYTTTPEPPTPDPAPVQPVRTVFARLSARAGRQLAKQSQQTAQAEQDQQAVLL